MRTVCCSGRLTRRCRCPCAVSERMADFDLQLQLSSPASFRGSPWRQQVVAGRRGLGCQLLPLWDSPCCCGHLNSEPVGGTLALSLLSLSPSPQRKQNKSNFLTFTFYFKGRVIKRETKGERDLSTALPPKWPRQPELIRSLESVAFSRSPVWAQGSSTGPIFHSFTRPETERLIGSGVAGT